MITFVNQMKECGAGKHEFLILYFIEKIVVLDSKLTDKYIGNFSIFFLKDYAP